MISSRKILTLAFLIGGWSLLHPTLAEAKTKKHHHPAAKLSPNLGFGRVKLPLDPREVAQFNANVNAQGPTPPAIPGVLLQKPLPKSVAEEAQQRRAFALELYRERALSRSSHIAGGIFFTPPFGTPYFPVQPLNAFNYLPVFRILGRG